MMMGSYRPFQPDANGAEWREHGLRVRVSNGNFFSFLPFERIWRWGCGGEEPGGDI